LFATTGTVPIGYAAFAFALGAAAGVLLRRTLPAMAVTLGVFAVIQVLVPLTVRPHLIPPAQTTVAVTAVSLDNNMATTRTGNEYIAIGPGASFSPEVTGISGQPGAWIVGSKLVGATGQTMTTLPSACVGPGPGGGSPGGGSTVSASCLTRHGTKIVVSYQPASRYWDLQSAETGMYLVLAAGLGVLCYWAVRRRQRAA
jgi:hypothetical protein